MEKRKKDDWEIDAERNGELWKIYPWYGKCWWIFGGLVIGGVLWGDYLNPLIRDFYHIFTLGFTLGFFAWNSYLKDKHFQSGNFETLKYVCSIIFIIGIVAIFFGPL